MKVRLVQSGGLVGIVRECQLDSAILAPEAAEELLRLVRGSGIQASGAFLTGAARDLQQYEITIEEEHGTISVVFDDESLPPSAKPMIGLMKKRARPHQPG